jgi:hypothetical protein
LSISLLGIKAISDILILKRVVESQREISNHFEEKREGSSPFGVWGPLIG